MIKFALAGNPNCGKTTLFNALTGSTAHVGNWPGVTVDKREGVYKKLDEPVEIVDLPGIYSLSPYTPEEVISRNYILDEKPDCVINIVDATNLERNLYLTTQIMEIDVPVVVALNMIDVVNKRGDKIDAKKLESKLGVPVAEISALKDEGIRALMERAFEAAQKKREGTTVLRASALSHVVDDVKIALKGKGVENPLFHAVKLTEGDELEVGMHPNETGMVEEFKKQLQKESWEFIFRQLKMDRFVTNGVRATINKFIETQVNVPFTMKNIYIMLDMIVKTQGNRMNDSLVDAFDLICSFSAENSTAGEKWRTNANYMINKKFIVPCLCSYDSRWPSRFIKANYSSSYKNIEDLFKALNYISGENIMLNLYQYLRQNDIPWGEWFNFGYFRIKGFKKGTMHFEFLDENLWMEFNQRVAKIKGWALPKKTESKRKKAA